MLPSEIGFTKFKVEDDLFRARQKASSPNTACEIKVVKELLFFFMNSDFKC